MKIKEKSSIRGKVRLDIIDFATGKKWSVEGPNTVTVAGDAYVADALSDRGDVTPANLYMGAGSGSGGKTSASNALETPVGSRVQIASATQGTGADDNDVVYQGVFPAGTATGTWKELGLFNASSSGNMHAYSETPTIDVVKTASMQITANWTWTFGAS